jgi:hypothetical protein
MQSARKILMLYVIRVQSCWKFLFSVVYIAQHISYSSMSLLQTRSFYILTDIVFVYTYGPKNHAHTTLPIYPYDPWKNEVCGSV